MNLHYAKDFKSQLMNGSKIHTLRRNAVEPGTPIKHIVYPYHPDKRECILENECISCQAIKIDDIPEGPNIRIGGRQLSPAEALNLARNDGFDSLTDFWNFFAGGFEGYVVHWTNLKY